MSEVIHETDASPLQEALDKHSAHIRILERHDANDLQKWCQRTQEIGKTDLI